MGYEKVDRQLTVDERVLKILNKFDVFDERGEINPRLLRMFVKLVFNSKGPKEFKKWQEAIKDSEIFTDSQKSILLGMLAGKWAMNTGDFGPMFNEEYGGYGGTFDKTPEGCKLSKCQGWFANNRRTAWKGSENSGKAFRRSVSHGATFTGSVNYGNAFAESEISGSAFAGSYNFDNAFAKTFIYGSAFTGSVNYGNAFAGVHCESIYTFKGSVKRDEASSNILRALNA